MSLIHHIGISGGKDSTALLLWAIHESGLDRESLWVTFCDTDNEDDLTYQHLVMLLWKVIFPAKIKFETLIPKRGFFELAFWKKRFPARKAQFCTHHLKLYPTQDWIAARWAENHEVVVLNGKRTGESDQRKKSMQGKPDRAFSDFWGCEEWSPLASWSIEDVLAIHQRYNIPLNPLYALGAKRVGCFPCINCSKSDLRLVAKHRPQKIEQIAHWEKRFEIEQGRPNTFFAGTKMTTPQYRTKRFTDPDGKTYMVSPIEKVVEWAHTERGGKQQRLPLDEPKACWMNYGACE